MRRYLLTFVNITHLYNDQMLLQSTQEAFHFVQEFLARCQGIELQYQIMISVYPNENHGVLLFASFRLEMRK